MGTEEQIDQYMASLAAAKSAEMKILHQHIVDTLPKSKLWFFDGKDETGKAVSNPQIGYGVLQRKQRNGAGKEMFQIGISANSSGISVYILGLEDKLHLVNTYGNSIGKAIVSGYCIKFKKISDINMPVLLQAIVDGYDRTSLP